MSPCTWMRKCRIGLGMSSVVIPLLLLSPLLLVPSAAQMTVPDVPYVLPTAPVASAVLPRQPRVFVHTAFAPPPTGRTWTVPAGGNFQTALNNARPGDVIVLQAGAKYYGNFTLPYKTGTGWIYIESSALASLPAPGTRVTPAQASLMPQIIDTTGNPAIQTATAAHNYRLVGIEIMTTWSTNTHGTDYALVNLESPGGNTSLSQIPTNIVLDRCYIHGTPTGNVRNGVIINGADLAVVDSYISDIHEVNNEARGIVGWNGPGPFKIDNNEVQAAGENVMFTERPTIPNLVPSDIEIRGNHLDKPLTWLPSSSTYGGIPWTVKNNFELKNAARVLVDGNVFENNWVGVFQPQDGFCIQLTVRGVNAPWSVVEDVTFTHNIVQHCSAGINFLGRDYNGPSQEQERILVQNNLFADIGPYSTLWTAGLVFQVTDGGANYVIDHNTAFSSSVSRAGNPIYAQVHRASSWPATGFVFTNNVVAGHPGVSGDNTQGNPLLTVRTYFPNAVFARNVLVGGKMSDYPPDNFFSPSLDAVRFADRSRGDYRLATLSPYRRAGTDGRDIGAELDVLAPALRQASP
jgi:hypothetical protein